MNCPKDGSALEALNFEGAELDLCPKCDGIWMDWGELKRVSSNLVTEYELVFRGDSRRMCPKCGKKMRKADLHSVIIEECDCGIFFDSGEAEKVIGSAGKNIKLKSAKILHLSLQQLEQLREKKELTIGELKITLEN